MRVNVGCGASPILGWKNYDNSPGLLLGKVPLLPELLRRIGLLDAAQYDFIKFAQTAGIDHADITRGLPLPDASVDVLYSSHMLEHLDRAEASLFLKEARRLLRSGGIIRIAVPDIRKHVDEYIRSKDANAFIEGTLMTQPRPRSIAQRLRILIVGTRHHQWMYDGASLCDLLSTHGFLNAQTRPPGETLISDPQPLDLRERVDESAYVEAENP